MRKKPAKSGRKAGTPNAPTLVLLDQLDEHGIHPIKGLKASIKELDLIIAFTPTDKIMLAEAKAKIYIKLLEYLFPKRKALEVSELKDPNKSRVIEVKWNDPDGPNDFETQTPDAASTQNQ